MGITILCTLVQKILLRGVFFMFLRITSRDTRHPPALKSGTDGRMDERTTSILLPSEFLRNRRRVIMSNYHGDNWKFWRGGKLKTAVIGMVPVALKYALSPHQIITMINDLFCTLLFHVPEFRAPEPKSG